MNEPNLKAVLECLGDVGYCFKNEEGPNNVIEHFFERRGNVGIELEQLLFFCRREQTSTFENAISQIQDDAEKQRIVSALITMYPITKNIVLEMLKRADITPAEYLEIFDLDNCLLKNIKESLNKIMQSSAANNVKANIYSQELENIEKDVEILSAQRDEMIANIKNYKEKVGEKNRLNEEIEKLKKNGGLDAEIDDLRNKRNRLDKQRREKEEEKEKLQEEISKLNEYLQSRKDKDENADYQNALKSLEVCVKALAIGR